MKSSRILGLVWLIVIGCETAPEQAEVRSEITEVGDTVVVMNRGQPSTIRPDSVEVLWRGTELEDPRAMLVANDRLIIADPTRVHILALSGEHLHSVGRDGEGPGEFRSVYALGQFSADTLAVLDARNQRITFITHTGQHLDDVRDTPILPYVNPVQGSRLVPFQNGLVSPSRENIHVDRPTRTALVWRDLEADTAAVLAVWDGQQWKEFGDRLLGADRLFGPQVIVALAADGRYAVGDGLDYCVSIRSLGHSETRSVCRDRSRVPVGDGVRRPDLTPIEDERRRAMLRSIIDEQEVEDYLPSYDRLLFSSDGRLWVRSIASELGQVHPYLLNFTPERAPDFRTWDVFDSTGRLVRSVDVPARFKPQAITSDRIYGFLELPTGEITIGGVHIPVGTGD